MLRWIGAWLAGTLVTYALGSAFMTQVVVADLGALGVTVDAGARLEMTIRDIVGLSTSYLPLIALAQAIAQLVATGIARALGGFRQALAIAAGATAMLCLLLILKQVLGLNPLSGSRGIGGHALQVTAGAVGGLLFARILAARAARSSRSFSPKPVPGIVLVLLLLPAVAPASALDGLPASIIRLPDELDSVLVAATDESTLYRYFRTVEGGFAAESFYMSIGVNGIRKERRGDRKTPLGVYVITEQLDTRGLNEKYGITAFPLDYPNAIDRLAGRTGDGIWLHGVLPGGERRPERDTDGCIALPNESLAALQHHLEAGSTPIIVTNGLKADDAPGRERIGSELDAAIGSWRQAQLDGSLDTYLASYAEDFRYRGLDLDAFAAMRAVRFSREKTIRLDISELMLLADPVTPNLYLARFDIHWETAGGRRFAGSKRLYWQRDIDGLLRIVAEDNG